RILPDDLDLPGDVLLIEASNTSTGAFQPRSRLCPNQDAGRIAYLVSVAAQKEVRHVQLEERRALGALQWPNWSGIRLPIRQPRQEVRLRGPEHAVVHHLMIFQALE